MAIRTTNNSMQFELAPEGMHVARCYRIIDCGTVMDRKFGKPKRLGWIFWELPATNRNAGKTGDLVGPFTVGKRYTLSHNEKAILRLDLESWYGRRFDTRVLDERGGIAIEKLVGRAALLNIVHSEDGQYANVVSVNPLPDGMQCPPAVNPPFIFGFDPYEPGVFAKLSDRMQEFIKGSAEWQKINNGHGPGGAGAAPKAPAGSPVGTTSGGDSDLPYGGVQSQEPHRVLQKPVGSKFDDMEDDIPF